MKRKALVLLFPLSVFALLAFVYYDDELTLASLVRPAINSCVCAAILFTGQKLGWFDWRKRKPGHCRKCGYNLAGNVSGRCPECGRTLQPYE